LVFVANLPFSVGDEQLAEVFNGFSISIKSAKVITKPGHRKKGGDESAPAPAPRSKGFGFVETNSQEQQKLALEKLQGYKIGDREIVVKVANERQAVEERAEVKAEGDSN
jgi:RNA recognition motif-containing protein